MENSYFGRLIAFNIKQLKYKIAQFHLARIKFPFFGLDRIKNSVLFVGYVEAGLGIGESLRGLLAAVAETDLPFAIYPFNVNVESRFVGQYMPERYDLKNYFRINVIEMAADEVPGMFNELGERRTRNSYNILRTYWELPNAPQEWKLKLVGISEIWAPNQFVADSFRCIFNGPITIVPPCVDVKNVDKLDRSNFGMNEDRFYFIFSFDYHSFPARKNPLGVLHSFQKAFPNLTENVGLIIKSVGLPDHYPAIKAEIAQAANLDNRIIVIDGSISRSEVLSLIANCDCYVSLHRAEGFGLGMAEAMALGVSVIATNYSGSTDFLSDRTGFPIPYELRQLNADEYVWSAGQTWAEPDESAAVHALRRVYNEKSERQVRLTNARSFVENRYGRSAVGLAVQNRIGQLIQNRTR
jgi:glycosyltransferase involved in cell wall biosynthesis